MGHMSLEEMTELLRTDEVARARYIGSVLLFLEGNGVKVTKEMLHKFDDEAIRVAEGTFTTNVIVTIF